MADLTKDLEEVKTLIADQVKEATQHLVGLEDRLIAALASPRVPARAEPVVVDGGGGDGVHAGQLAQAPPAAAQQQQHQQQAAQHLWGPPGPRAPDAGAPAGPPGWQGAPLNPAAGIAGGGWHGYAPAGGFGGPARGQPGAGMAMPGAGQFVPAPAGQSSIPCDLETYPRPPEALISGRLDAFI